MERMRIKHNETGRSMVEMLGVLAIMGVLSIGGVAGYRYAVDKMNANEIINELKKRAITASQQRVLSQNINLSEYGAILGKYEVTPTNGYPEDPAFFGLEIKAVPQKVCQHIVDSDWALPTEMKIGNLIMDRDTECPDEFNDMTFAFNNTLGSGDVGNGKTPDVTIEATTEVTATETEVSESDEMWTDLDETEVSESDEIWTDLEISDSISDPEESVSGGGQCGSGQFMDTSGSCYSCSTSSRYISATAEECAKCDDTSTPRVMSASGNYCVLPCGSGEFMISGGSCVSCSHSSGLSATAEECAKCDDTSTPRTMYGDYCGLKSCPSGKVVSANGNCASPCGSGQFMNAPGNCISCLASYGVSVTAEECAKCDDTSTPRFMSSSGSCYSCSYSSGISTTSEECAKCGDARYMEGGYCKKR